MAEAVRCEVCGKLFSSSRLKAHQRLAHAKAVLIVPSDDDGVATIVKVYKKLSMEKRREVHSQLALLDQQKS